MKQVTKDLKKVNSDTYLHIPGAVSYYIEDDIFFFSCDNISYKIEGDLIIEVDSNKFKFWIAKHILGDITAFIINENYSDVLYFTVTQRVDQHPIFIFKRGRNFIEECYLPKLNGELFFDSLIHGTYGSIDGMSYNICKNMTTHIKNPKRRKTANKELNSIINNSSFKNDKALKSEINYILKRYSDSQIYYGGVIDFYKNKAS